MNVMSNIRDGQQRVASSCRSSNSDKKLVSLAPLVDFDKMISLIVLVFSVATLFDSSAFIEASSASELPSLGQLRHNRLTNAGVTRLGREANLSTHRQHRRQRNTTTIAKMQRSGPRKRSSLIVSPSIDVSSNQSKRFRSSLEEETFISRESSVSTSNSTSSRGHDTHSDSNNQIIAAIQDDNNNNTVYSVERTRQVSSLNGTIDLSRYEQDDVDRLYSDALLVYVKNFNQ